MAKCTTCLVKCGENFDELLSEAWKLPLNFDTEISYWTFNKKLNGIKYCKHEIFIYLNKMQIFVT